MLSSSLSGFQGFIPHKKNITTTNTTNTNTNTKSSPLVVLNSSPFDCYQRIEAFMLCRERDCLEKINVLMKSSNYTSSMEYSSDDVVASSSSLFPSLL